MTLDEARKVAAIMNTADGGCPSCAGDLIDRFVGAFPQFRVSLDGTYAGWRCRDDPCELHESQRAFSMIEVTEG